MFYAIFFVVAFVISLVIIAVGWRKRPATRPAKVTPFGWATLGLGVGAILCVVLSVTAPFSILFAGLGLMTGSIALISRDTHQLTIVGQSIVALPALFWIVFLVAEITFPHA